MSERSERAEAAGSPPAGDGAPVPQAAAGCTARSSNCSQNSKSLFFWSHGRGSPEPCQGLPGLQGLPLSDQPFLGDSSRARPKSKPCWSEQAYMFPGLMASSQGSISKENKKPQATSSPNLAPAWAGQVHSFRIGGVQPRFHRKKLGASSQTQRNLAIVWSGQVQLVQGLQASRHDRFEPDPTKPCTRLV